MRGWRAVGMQAPHPRVFSAWRAPSSYVTHAHAFQEDQTTYAPLPCVLVTCSVFVITFCSAPSLTVDPRYFSFLLLPLYPYN